LKRRHQLGAAARYVGVGAGIDDQFRIVLHKLARLIGDLAPNVHRAAPDEISGPRARLHETTFQ